MSKFVRICQIYNFHPFLIFGFASEFSKRKLNQDEIENLFLSCCSTYSIKGEDHTFVVKMVPKFVENYCGAILEKKISAPLIPTHMKDTYKLVLENNRISVSV